MNIAALIAWVLTAGGGFVLLARWISGGGLRQQHGGGTRFPAGLIFGHFGLAAAGLVLWIVYLVVGGKTLAWISLVLLAVVAVLGFTMFARWLPGRRGAVAPVGTGALRHDSGTAPVTATGSDPAERHLPVPVVAAHGVFAVVTVVLVLLTALGVGT